MRCRREKRLYTGLQHFTLVTCCISIQSWYEKPESTCSHILHKWSELRYVKESVLFRCCIWHLQSWGLLDSCSFKYFWSVFFFGFTPLSLCHEEPFCPRWSFMWGKVVHPYITQPNFVFVLGLCVGDRQNLLFYVCCVQNKLVHIQKNNKLLTY